ncbi:3e953730-ef10-4872-95e2-e05e853e76e3 [Sclerotinia trifoliorum]|uniref:3e953730-ef10-4872-95e2-e05e853e76e3 n=1 Tax=Sclerotinia trifoliorum TaxID=28548 RepID=A0A8H2ZYJ4_9HELO|nr:3e953730-ef10-4872-95e2-e05e853e76e3 [Sclerotinia trifoliorum]
MLPSHPSHLIAVTLSLLPTIILATNFNSTQTCKITPADASWPSSADWTALNTSISGALIKTLPAASSCYTGNPFNSTENCSSVQTNWVLASWQANTPEGIDYPIYANNSCLPTNATGYQAGKGCEVGGSPVYVVNATTEDQIATAMKWATERNIRIVIKGTGHDLSGRSSGANSLSIWTQNFLKREFNSSWRIPGSNSTADVLIAGSGNNLELIYNAAHEAGKSIVGGDAKTVGLGGYLQGGGHGPLSSQYGLGADQIHQATVITPSGEILTANAEQNPDLLWAIRGGGPGTYGVVTEYVLQAHPAVASISSVNLEAIPLGSENDTAAATAAWNALAILFQNLPDLMDTGLAGAMTAATGSVAKAFSGSESTPPGVYFSQAFYGYNISISEMTTLISPLIEKIKNVSNGSLSINYTITDVYPSYLDFFYANDPTEDQAGQISLLSTRLLGRAQLSDLPMETVAAYLQRALASQSGSGNEMIVGLQGGPGPAHVPENMRGSLNPVWRETYLHVITLGATLDDTLTPKETLANAAEWIEENREALWREWAPDMGAYINEANPFNTEWKHDFFGTSYDQLAEIKKKYDPTGSLYILSGVRSDEWDYDLDTGKLCRV